MGARTARGTRARRAWLVAGAMLLTTIVAVAGAPPAEAATFVVDSTADTSDATPGDGVCADAGGDCTLRAAIEEANQSDAPDAVTVPAGTYAVTTPLVVSRDLTLTGAGTAATRVHASTSVYLMELGTVGVSMAVADLTIGRGDHTLDGYGIKVHNDDIQLHVDRVHFDGLEESGIIVCCGPTGEPDDVTVVVTRSEFSASDYSVLLDGGTNPVLEVADSTFAGNFYGILFASLGGGAMSLDGSLIHGTAGPGIEFYGSSSALHVTDSTIRDSVDTFGEGIYASGDDQTIELVRTRITGHPYQGLILSGDVTIRDSTVSDNGREGLDQANGSLLVEGSTFAGNEGYGIGAFRGLDGSDSVVIRNTTVHGNGGDDGYGVYVGNTYGAAVLQNVTATGNDFALGLSQELSSVTIRNTLLVGNQAACDQVYPSGGHNLTGDPSCGFAAAGDVVGAAKLGPLADNGGTTLTRMPAADSPAVDAGTVTGCPAMDQRGTTRPRDGDGDGVATCDIGAVERDGQAAATADLRLSKSADRDRAAIGELVTYTLTVRNDGPDAATGVRVTDPLPEGLVFSSSPDGCVETSAGGVRCDVGTLADGASATRRVVAAVTDDGAITNTAQVAADSVDPVAGNDTGSATVDVDAPSGDTRRIFGIDRIETAVAASQDTYEAGEAGAVVLARDDTFPDALAGAPLAVANRAPLLLTSSGALDDRTAAELARVLPGGGTVHLLGGTVALSPAVEAAVVDRGYEVVRYPGADRYETAVLIAEALGDPGAVFVATGTNFPDALTSGAAAAELGGVIVLTAHDQMVPVTAGYLAEHADVPRYAVGGPAAAADPEATPVVGADRFATALAVATRFFEDPVVVGVAVGTNFPDALSGDTHIARRRAPMLLVGPDLLPDDVAAYLRANAASIRQVFLYGGEAAIAPQVEAEIGGALS